MTKMVPLFLAWMGKMYEEADPGIRRMVAMASTHDGNAFPDEFADYVVIWCISADQFPKHFEKTRELQTKGKEIWFYNPGFFNYDGHLTARRIAPWICWKYGFKGFLHTNSTAWIADFRGEVAEDPWSGLGHHSALLYPGSDGPVDSIGWENLRDGMEDYEYFHLLRGIIDQLRASQKAKPDVLAAAESFLAIGPELVEEPLKWTKNGQDLLDRRERLGDQIEQLTRLLVTEGED